MHCRKLNDTFLRVSSLCLRTSTDCKWHSAEILQRGVKIMKFEKYVNNRQATLRGNFSFLNDIFKKFLSPSEK